jgi:hypothetical protein
LEDSLPQASFIAASNSRYVSVKQGAAYVCFGQERYLEPNPQSGVVRAINIAIQFLISQLVNYQSILFFTELPIFFDLYGVNPLISLNAKSYRYSVLRKTVTSVNPFSSYVALPK